MNAVGPGFGFEVDYADRPMIGGLRDFTVENEMGLDQGEAEGNGRR